MRQVEARLWLDKATQDLKAANFLLTDDGFTDTCLFFSPTVS